MYSSAEDLFGDGWFPVSKVYSSAQDLFQKTCPDFGGPNPEAVDRSFWSLRIFGDYGNALYSSKGRLWVDYAKNFFDDRGIEYPGSSGYEIETAVNAARSARFEHGQKGAR
jgi:hypothetical protein